MGGVGKWAPLPENKPKTQCQPRDPKTDLKLFEIAIVWRGESQTILSFLSIFTFVERRNAQKIKQIKFLPQGKPPLGRPADAQVRDRFQLQKHQPSSVESESARHWVLGLDFTWPKCLNWPKRAAQRESSPAHPTAGNRRCCNKLIVR